MADDDHGEVVRAEVSVQRRFQDGIGALVEVGGGGFQEATETLVSAAKVLAWPFDQTVGERHAQRSGREADRGLGMGPVFIQGAGRGDLAPSSSTIDLSGPTRMGGTCPALQ